MIEGLKPYAEYKESGSRWIGSVPSSWTVRNLRTLITHRSERNRPDLPLLSVAREKGVFVRSLTDANENHNVIPEDLTNYKVARSGDLVINKMKAWQGSMGIAPSDGIVSPAYFVFEFHIANHAFGQALLRSKPYVAHFGQASDGVRIGQWDLSIPGMRQIPILMPNEDEQAAIVRFLDYTNRKINRFIRTKRRLIELLNEQKQTIIRQAVTRGLDPKVRLKPSGVEWLGNVPEHWEVKKLKYIKRHEPNSFVDGPFGSNLKSIHFVDNGDAYVVESGFITRGHFILKEFKTITREHFETIRRSECRGGDIIIAKIGAYFGMAGILPDLDKPAVVSGNALKLTINEQLCSNNFVHFALLTARALGALDWIVNATAQPAISLGAMNNVSIPLPNVDEQLGIIAFIHRHTEKFDFAINKANLEISLLREYRTRLISDVITGKLDVRGVELPAMDEPETLEDISPGEDIEAEDLIESEEVANADE